MHLLTVIHQDDAGPGVFEAPGVRMTTWRPDREPVPELGDVDAALVLGAAINVHQADEHPWLDREIAVITELGARRVPILGVCLGAQLLAQAAGGSVRRSAQPEIGWYDVELEGAAADDPVVGALPARFTSFQWHSYEAVPPPGAVVLARSAHSLQAYRLADAPAWAIQFHAEVSTADAAYWIREYSSDPDAVAMGIDPRALQAQTDERMDAWHRLGRALFARFMAAAGDGRPSHRGRPSAVAGQPGSGSFLRSPGS